MCCLILFQASVGLAIQGLTRNFGPGCVEDGTSVNYTCTVVDTGTILSFTVWEGSGFVCPPTNGIILEHFIYSTTGESESCTGGAFFAESVGVVENEYTSRLDVMASRSPNGTTIECNIA